MANSLLSIGALFYLEAGVHIKSLS